ncbi:MAG: YbaN family protein [Bacteroidia bacterium]|nr:YbaN family protein [Bacteroidia bacterium]
MRKKIFITLGFVNVTLGILGIFLPVLPTTPFLLLAAFLFSRSSQHFHQKLLKNKYLGKYISSYIEKKIIPARVKLITLLLLWITILSSVIFFIDIFWLKIILLFIASVITAHILLIKSK